MVAGQTRAVLRAAGGGEGTLPTKVSLVDCPTGPQAKCTPAEESCSRSLKSSCWKGGGQNLLRPSA